ncbi:MAG TPA: hypothetical protein VGS27_17240 [Candidatus Sulfotelmatobacter sp.]|nr:hypothetical protein [Candidatus Sulfotelmatobacter sp.]
MKLAKNRAAILAISHKIYERSLVLYPKDLRGGFGDEMSEVFDEQLGEAYSRSGFSGLVRVWFRATREVVTVAVPGRFAQRAVPIVGVAATIAFMLWFASYISYVMQTACSGCSIN